MLCRGAGLPRVPRVLAMDEDFLLLLVLALVLPRVLQGAHSTALWLAARIFRRGIVAKLRNVRRQLVDVTLRIQDLRRAINDAESGRSEVSMPPPKELPPLPAPRPRATLSSLHHQYEERWRVLQQIKTEEYALRCRLEVLRNLQQRTKTRE